MSQPTNGGKLLRRSRTDRYLGGVCGGLAAYLNMDPTLVRILTVVITLFTGAPVILYLVALFFMPEEDVVPVVPPVASGDPVWGAGGPPWSPGAQAPTSTWTGPEAAQPQPTDPPRRDDSGL